MTAPVASADRNPRPSTRDALLDAAALLFARHGVARVTTRQLHEAAGARNESAIHYHFGDRDGLVNALVARHVAAVEARRAPIVAHIAAAGAQRDRRALVEGFAVPLGAELATELGRAHLQVVAQLDRPALGYREPFTVGEAPAGRTLAVWIVAALEHLPVRIRAERLAAFRWQLINAFGQHARLIDDRPRTAERDRTELFVENLIDMLVASLEQPPSPASLAACERLGPPGPRRPADGSPGVT